MSGPFCKRVFFVATLSSSPLAGVIVILAEALPAPKQPAYGLIATSFHDTPFARWRISPCSSKRLAAR